MKKLALLSLAAAAALLSACSSGTGTSGSSGSSSGGCVDYSTVTGTPKFSKDVIPIFQVSCGLSASCHASKDQGAGCQPIDPSTLAGEGFALGAPTMCGAMSPADITAVHDGIVNVTANRSTLKRVAPGDPANSFLMAKIEYSPGPTACPDIAAKCTPKGCGTQMPQNGPPLTSAQLNTIAAWIKNGAKND